MKSAIKLSAIALALVAAGSAQAAITFNTANWNANAINTFGVSGSGAAAAARVTITAVGTTKRLADATVTDPETGLPEVVESFNFPITTASVNILSAGKLADPVTGASVGTGLKFTRLSNVAGIANLSVDFKTSVIKANVVTGTNFSALIPVFSVKDPKNTVTTISGFALNMKGSLSDLTFLPEVADSLGAALQLSPALIAGFKSASFGTLNIDVSSKSRPGGKLNGKPLTIAAFTPATAP